MAALLPVVLALSFALSGFGEAEIRLERDGATLLVQGLFHATGDHALSYRLEAEKRGASGTSTSRQGGTFDARRGEEAVLSTVRLGVQPGDTVEVHLTIYEGDHPIAEAHTLELVAP
ncbi:MAG TPA: curli-like amyloid fiber formation chaperone CsgH [Rubricoccaceae bacterium]|nr:curli-like amyloid fiber formation chaperone CsgH [Rubricoccaceae bacterium]